MKERRHCRRGEGPMASVDGCGHLLADFHDYEGCHAAARGHRNARYYRPDGYEHTAPPPNAIIERCTCLRPYPESARHRDEPTDAAYLDSEA